MKLERNGVVRQSHLDLLHFYRTRRTVSLVEAQGDDMSGRAFITAIPRARHVG